MHFSKTIFAALALMAVAVPAAQADMVVNGGFETGDFTGWTLVGGDTGVSNTSFDGFTAHSGNDFAFLGTVGGLGSLSQTFSTTAGQLLTLDYFLAADGGTPSSFEADWNGTAIAGSVLTNSPLSGYVKYTFNLLATGNDTLTFLARNDPSYWAFDDISLNVAAVIGVPEPVTLSLFGAGLAGMGAFGLRRKIKKS